MNGISQHGCTAAQYAGNELNDGKRYIAKRSP